jgi:hypothetical protein
MTFESSSTVEIKTTAPALVAPTFVVANSEFAAPVLPAGPIVVVSGASVGAPDLTLAAVTPNVAAAEAVVSITPEQKQQLEDFMNGIEERKRKRDEDFKEENASSVLRRNNFAPTNFRAGRLDDASAAPIFRVLACDGGGVRGLATATFLNEWENTLGGRTLASMFDLFVGTSTGSFIAALLGCARYKTAQIVRLYKDEAGAMMPNSLFPVLFGTQFGLSKQKVLSSELPTVLFNSPNKRVIIPAYNISPSGAGITLFDTQNPKHQNLHAWEVCDGSSAAPTYYPAAKIGGELYIDGGMVLNNPVLVGFQAAFDFLAKNPQGEVQILSLGTMARPAVLGASLSATGLTAAKPASLFLTDPFTAEKLAQSFASIAGKSSKITYHRFLSKPPSETTNLSIDDVSSTNLKQLESEGQDAFKLAHSTLREFE